MTINLKRYDLTKSQQKRIEELIENIKIDKHLLWWYSDKVTSDELKEIDDQLKQLQEKRAEVVKRQKESKEKRLLHSRSLVKSQEELEKILDSGNLISKLIKATIKARETEKILQKELGK
jgi:hypothetical protein